MIISTENLLQQIAPVTHLTGAVSVGSGTLPVNSLNQFSASWALQVGNTAEDRTEIVLLGASAPAGTIGTLSGTTLFGHPTDTPVYGIKYDQVVFERSTTGTAGTATPIANGTVTIMANGTATIFDDTSGSSSYAYKTYFRNSVLNATSPESDWITSAGYPPYSLASIKSRIKDKLFNSSYLPDDLMINDWTNEWLETMSNAAIQVTQDYSLGSTQVSFAGTAELGTITAADFKQDRRVWFTSDGVNYYEAGRLPINEVSPMTVYDATAPQFYYAGDNVIGRLPHNGSGTACIIYSKNAAPLQSDGDVLPVSMQGYSKSFVDYGVAQALRKDNRSEEADAMESGAVAQLTRFKADITPRSQSGPEFARMDEEISGSDDFWI